MVNLSLQHRVKLEKQASLFSEANNETPRRTLLAVAATLAVLNVLFMIAGAVLAGIIDFSWYPGPGSQGSWYKDENVKVNRAAAVFFYMTVPTALAAVSTYESLQHWRNTAIGPTLAIISGTAGTLLWPVQLALQGTCVWPIAGNTPGSYVQGFCPYSLTNDWDGWSFGSSGLAVASYLTWCIVAVFLLYITHLVLGTMFLIHQRRAAGKPPVLERAYTYHSPVEDTELQTDRDMPDRSAAPTPVPSTDQSSPPPSYRSASVFHEDVPAEKEKEMV